MRTLLGVLLAVLASVSVSHAQQPPAMGSSQAYRYVDERGVIHWAQSIHLVPPAYVSKAVTPAFNDPMFPTPGPYVRPPTPTVLAVTIDHQPFQASVHERYAEEIRRRVTAAWKGRGQQGPQPRLTFYVARDGRLSIPDIDRSSGDIKYDFTAREVLVSIRQLPPLPTDFIGGRLLVRLVFADVR